MAPLQIARVAIKFPQFISNENREASVRLATQLVELQTTVWNLAMRTVTLGSTEEKRRYFRLLRYLLSEELKTDYKKELEKPLPPRITDLLSRIESEEDPDVR